MGKSVRGRNKVSLQSRPVWTFSFAAGFLFFGAWRCFAAGFVLDLATRRCFFAAVLAPAPWRATVDLGLDLAARRDFAGALRREAAFAADGLALVLAFDLARDGFALGVAFGLARDGFALGAAFGLARRFVSLALDGVPMDRVLAFALGLRIPLPARAGLAAVLPLFELVAMILSLARPSNSGF